MAGTDRKHRVTFRVAPDLAAALRGLPNQTAFVEGALREALGRTCPLCEGRGRTAAVALSITDFRRHALGRLDGPAARRLRAVVRLGRRLSATRLELVRSQSVLAFRLARKDEPLLEGRIGSDLSIEGGV